MAGNTFKISFLATRFVCACFDKRTKMKITRIFDCKLHIDNNIYIIKVHNDNMPMQNIAIFNGFKNGNFSMKNVYL